MSLTTWLAVAYLALVSTCLAYIWWNDGIRKIGAGRAVDVQLRRPGRRDALGHTRARRVARPAQLIGGVLILGGLFVANRR